MICRGPAAVNTSNDKGKRFTFPSGINTQDGGFTPIRCQAHSDHWVAPTIDGNNDEILDTDQSNSNTLIVETNMAENNQVTIALKTSERFIGYDGSNLYCKS